MKRICLSPAFRVLRLLPAVFATLFLAGSVSGWAQVAQKLQGHLRPEVVKGTAARLSASPTSQHLHLTLQLPLRNHDELKSFLNRLYDPNSPDFHKYLSVESFTQKYGPSQEDFDSVVAFAKAHGMTVLGTPRNRMMVEVDSTVAQANEALHITLTEYQHPTEKRAFFSPDREPSLNLQTPLLHIAGLNNFNPPKARIKMNTTAKDTSSTYPPTPTGSGPYNSYIPSDFRAAYYGNGPLDGTGQTIGLLELDGYDQADLDNFYTNIGATQNVPVSVVLLGGLTAPMGDGGNDAEPILDMVYALSMTPNLSQLRVYQCCGTGYSGTESGAAVILNSIAAENIAKQTSCSYGWGSEPTVEDPIYEEMAAQGQSFFAATGDYGSPLNPGNNNYDDYYPADEAWVTAVSMSLLTTQSPGGAWAADIYAGGAGGGYSDGPNPIPLPSYQVGIANTSNQASTQFRNVPDVVIDGYGAYLCGGSNSTGQHQCYPNSGCTTCTNGGSSMSAPIWASLMALANEEAANENKPAIGFLNPALYSIGQSANYANDFHDIIGGSNNCCGETYAYNAVAGYDLVSGWGTPNGANLIADLMLQSASFTLGASSAGLSIGPDDSASTTVSIAASSGFSGNVQLTVSGLPSGVTAAFDTNPISTSSNLTFTSGDAPAAGTYPITITGTSGKQSVSTSLTLVVTSTQGNFTVGSTLTAAAIQDGTSVGPTANNANLITITSIDNFNGDVTLAGGNLPSGVTASFSPSVVSLTAGSTATSIMTLTASSTAPTGAFTASIQGNAGALTNAAPLRLSVTAAYTVGTTSTSFSVIQGQSTTIPVYVASQNGFNSAVALAVNNLPANVTAQFSPASVTPPANGSISSTLTLTAASSATLGSTAITLSGTSGGATANESTTISVITPPPAFTITSPQAFAFNVGQSGWLSVPIEVSTSLSGYNTPVTLSISGLPTGLTASFSPASVIPADSGNSAISTLTITADSTAVIDSFAQTTITGTAGAITNTLQIWAGASGSLTASNSVVSSGGSLQLNYVAASNLVTTGNWIGVFAHGASPQSPTPLLKQQAGSASGSVTVNVTNLSSGSYDAWLFYSGGTTTLAGPFTFTVGATPGFSLSSTPNYINMTSGGSETVAITLSSLNGFNAPVTLSVTGLPSGVTANFSNTSLIPSANGSVATVLTLTASGSTAMRQDHAPWMPITALALLFAPLTMGFVRRRKLTTALLMSLGFLCLLAAPIGCGSTKSTSSGSSQKLPSIIVVTGTSGTQTTTTSFSLLVP